MKRFIVSLTDDHRSKLEAYRAANGLRSEADAVRHLIDNASAPAAVEAAQVRQRVAEMRDRIHRGVRPAGTRINLDLPANAKLKDPTR